jgi:hypothetical protein
MTTITTLPKENSMHTRLNKKSVALAVAAALGVGAAADAGATAQAQSTTSLTNLLFYNPVTGAALDASVFDRLVIQDSTNLSPSVNGVFNSFTNSTVGGAPLPQQTQCIQAGGGTACTGLAAPYSNSVPPPTSSASLAASVLTGAPITGIGQPTPAQAKTDAIAQLVTPGVANSSANLGLTTQFSFVLSSDQAFGISFDTLIHELAYMDSPLFNATAGAGWTLDIVNQATGASVFHWAPDGVLGSGISGGSEISDACNLQISRGVIGPGTATFDCTGHEQAVTGILSAAITYTGSIAHQNRADVQLAVPEPATLALVGIGLLGAAVGSRRKVRQQG